MSDIAEKARELATKLDLLCSRTVCERCQAIASLIEQALLAERRLAKLEDAEIAETAMSCDCGSNDADSGCPVFIAKEIAQKLRAAVEKEVGK